MNTSSVARGSLAAGFSLSILAGWSPVANAAGYPTTGTQKLLVIPMERAHDPLCNDPPGAPTCPRYTAKEWEGLLDRELNSFFGQDSWGQTRWDVAVLENPATANDPIHKGWWPAPHTDAQYNTGGSLWHEDHGPAPVLDAMTVVLAEAIRKDPSLTALLSRERVLVLDNLPGHGGQTYGVNDIHEYSIRTTVNGEPKTFTVRPTITIARESSTAADAVASIEHELAHQLGAVDLYFDGRNPCKTRDPGGVVGPEKMNPACVGAWDHMGESGLGTGAGLLTRILHGWVDMPTQVPTITTERTKTVTLAPLEVKPLQGQLLGVRVRTGGSDTDPFQGIQVECRRKIGHDRLLGGEGALVTYIDQISNSGTPQWVMRRSETVPGGPNTNSVLESPGDYVANLGLRVRVAYVGTEPTGACIVRVGKPRSVQDLFIDWIRPEIRIPEYRRVPKAPIPDPINPPQRMH